MYRYNDRGVKKQVYQLFCFPCLYLYIQTQKTPNRKHKICTLPRNAVTTYTILVIINSRTFRGNHTGRQLTFSEVCIFNWGIIKFNGSSLPDAQTTKEYTLIFYAIKLGDYVVTKPSPRLGAVTQRLLLKVTYRSICVQDSIAAVRKWLTIVTGVGSYSINRQAVNSSVMIATHFTVYNLRECFRLCKKACKRFKLMVY